MKELARKPIEFKMRSALEVGCDYFDGYDFPVRPKWSFNMAKEQLDRNENRYFTVEFIFLSKIFSIMKLCDFVNNVFIIITKYFFLKF